MQLRLGSRRGQGLTHLRGTESFAQKMRNDSSLSKQGGLDDALIGRTDMLSPPLAKQRLEAGQAAPSSMTINNAEACSCGKSGDTRSREDGQTARRMDGRGECTQYTSRRIQILTKRFLGRRAKRRKESPQGLARARGKRANKRPRDDLRCSSSTGAGSNRLGPHCRWSLVIADRCEGPRPCGTVVLWYRGWGSGKVSGPQTCRLLVSWGALTSAFQSSRLILHPTRIIMHGQHAHGSIGIRSRGPFLRLGSRTRQPIVVQESSSLLAVAFAGSTQKGQRWQATSEMGFAHGAPRLLKTTADLQQVNWRQRLTPAKDDSGLLPKIGARSIS